MLQVAVCDDDSELLDFLEDSLRRYGEETGNTPLHITRFVDPKDLLEHIQGGKQYHIYILDMIMLQVDGVALGRAIRARDDRAAIIYLTASKEYAFDAWAVKAQRYLLKPVQESELREALRFAIAQATVLPAVFSVNTTQGIQTVERNDIEYVENMSRTLHVHMVDGREIVSRFLRCSFEESTKELLASESFVQVHKSYIVNLRHVKIYRQNMITVRSGKELPVSKNKQTGVKRVYLDYLSEKLG